MPALKPPSKSVGHGLDWAWLLRRLNEFYRKGNWRVPVLRRRGADPFLVLVSTVLSQRTRDEVTERATYGLLSVYPTARALARAPLHRIRKLIEEVGLAESKAKALRNSSRAIISRFGGRVPVKEADLLELPMVGPKTAHAIRVFGHRRPGLPVDTHVLRVTRRLGVVQASTISGAQAELAREVPRRYWRFLNPILVQHGQNICRNQAPLCVDCPISAVCQYARFATN